MNREDVELSEFLDLERGGQPPVELDNGKPLKEDQIQFILKRLRVVEEGASPRYETLPRAIQFMIEKIQDLDTKQAVGYLREALVDFRNDLNFSSDDYEYIERLLYTEAELSAGVRKNEKTLGKESFKVNTFADDWDLRVRMEAALIVFHSPYEEIRALTDPYDDTTTPVETVRAYTIGLFWTFIGAIVNNIFAHRLPSILLQVSTVQILFLACGKLWEKSFQTNKTIKVFSRTININPGKWSSKEMMFATIMYLCSSGVPYLIYNVIVMRSSRFYDLHWVSWKFQLLLMLSTQCLGFGFAGIMRRVCVYPSKAIWPTILPTLSLNRTLGGSEKIFEQPVNGWSLSRYSFFFAVFVGTFFYNWIPSVFFTALSTFNWPTWFAPTSIHLNNVTGLKSGLGLNPLPTFDWNIIDTGSCLTLPFYTYANQYLGQLVAFGIILMLYYTNTYWTAYLPINSNALFNNRGETYNVHSILNERSQFDSAKYEEYGPPYFSAANLVIYGAHFCLYPFAIIYQLISEWGTIKSGFRSIWRGIKGATWPSFANTEPSLIDPHCRMMSNYKEVPNGWFVWVLFASIVAAVWCVFWYPTETPVLGLFAVIFLNFIFLIPLTAIASTTGFSFGLNVLVELFVGYCIPNSGISLIILKSYGYNIDHQASNYITDQKLAHYAKVPPRCIFRGQLVSTVLSSLVALATTNWLLSNVQDFCAPHQKERLSCPGANTYFFASIQYGEIGPAKVFSGLYPVLKWCFLLGVLLVIPCLFFKKRYTHGVFKYFQPTIMMGGFLLYAPYNLLYYTCGFYLSYIFMYYIKKYYAAWWERYNYILTSALSAGVAFSSLIIFATFRYNLIEINWWGNSVSNQGIEGGSGRLSWLNANEAPEGYIGIRKGSFP